MKIFSTEQIRKADAYTIENEPVSSIDLMERAANQLYQWIIKKVDNTHPFKIFVGLGNNGGDGLVLARLLLKKDYLVDVYVIRYSDSSSNDFQVNYKRLADIDKSTLIEIKTKKDFPNIEPDDIVVDAIFGSGLTRPVTGFIADAIHFINQSNAVKIAIDIPSGLFADDYSDAKKGAIINADYTLSFQFPKLAFLQPDNDQFLGQWKILDIGLMAEYINNTSTTNFFMKNRDIIPMLKSRNKFSHKGTFGHALLIAGGYGKIGAAVLASKSCLRSGVGLLHTHIPKVAMQIMQTATPETMLSIDRYENYFSEIPDLKPFAAIGIGPGLGMEQQSQMALKLLIQEFQCPIVFDADALNILAENKTWLSFIPKGSILTPHPKEFERLVGKWSNDFQKLQYLKDFSYKYGVYTVLKGAHTVTCFPDGKFYFNSSGNPGMATAGSGDVLTGIITGLLAQRYSPGIAAVVGVYIHGLAGDMVAKKLGQEAMIAGDIIDGIGKAFKKLK